MSDMRSRLPLTASDMKAHSKQAAPAIGRHARGGAAGAAADGDAQEEAGGQADTAEQADKKTRVREQARKRAAPRSHCKNRSK